MYKSHKKIVYSILESINSHLISDDHDIALEFVADKVNDINIRLLEEQAKQGMSLDPFYKKTCCIEIKCERTSCVIDGKTVESGDVVWYSEIPSLNQKIGWKNISFLGPSNLSNGYHRVPVTGFVSGAKLDWAQKPIYTVTGNKIYYLNLPESGTKFICMVGIFSNPTNLCDFNEEDPYPTPDPYKLEMLVKQDILATYPNIPKDEYQDGRDNINSGNPSSTNQQTRQSNE